MILIVEFAPVYGVVLLFEGPLVVPPALVLVCELVETDGLTLLTVSVSAFVVCEWSPAANT